MKKSLLFLVLVLAFECFGQTSHCSIVASRQGGVAINGDIPAGVPVVFAVSSSFTGNIRRDLEVTFGNGFVPDLTNVPSTRNGNVVTYQLPNNANALSTVFTFFGTINCAQCTGTIFNLTYRILESGIETCQGSYSANVSNENLSWVVQSLTAPQSINTLRGSTVRYLLTLGNNNRCFDVSRTINLVNQIPSGANFSQAFYRTANTGSLVNIQVINNGNGEIVIPANPAITRAVYVDIFYPCDYVGNTATNSVRLIDHATVPCQSNREPNREDLTINIVNNLTPTSGSLASLTKTLGPSNLVQNFEPGGLVGFEIVFTNTSNFPLTNIEITDILPANYTGNHAYTIGNITTSNLVGSNPFLITSLNAQGQWSSVASTTNPNAINSRGFILTSQPNFRLMPNESIRFIIFGTTQTGEFNAQVLNSVNANYEPIVPSCSANNGVFIPTDGVGFSNEATTSFNTNGNNPNIWVGKLVCSKPCFNVGDEVRFELHLVNRGNSPLGPNGMTIRDILPTNLQFITGSETFYLFPHTMTTPHPTNIDCDRNNELYPDRLLINPSFITTNHSASNLSWYIGQGQLVPNPNLPSNIPQNYTLYSDRIVIAFSCIVTNTPIPNNRGINDRVTVTDVNSSFQSWANYNICEKDEITAQKLVSLDGTNFSNHVNAPAGSPVRYQIRLENTGNMPLTNIRIVDDMPHQGDMFLGAVNGVNCGQRNSEFEILANHNNLLTQGNIQFFTTHQPCISALFDYGFVNQNSNLVSCCSQNNPTIPTPNSTGTGFYVDLGAFQLLPGQIWIYEFDGSLPTGLNNGLTACNSFSYRASRSNSNLVLELGESNVACVTTENPVQTKCEQCDDISIATKNDRLVSQQTRNGISYQMLRTQLNIAAPQVDFNQIRVNVISYSFKSNFDECLICDKNSFNNVGINGDVFQNSNPFVIVDGQPTSPFQNSNDINLNVSEVNWRSAQMFNFLNTAELPLQFYLPNFSTIDCCKVIANICLRVTFSNDGCEVCEKIICLDTSVIDENQVKCECQKSDSFEANYKTKRKQNQRQFPSKIKCGQSVSIPTGTQVSMVNNSACVGDEKCTATYKWELIDATSQLALNSGNGVRVNFTVPNVGSNYYLVISTYCGNVLCGEPCKVLIKPTK